jgi:predicted DNA-binding protein (MmcQ/YjbR family)
LFQLDGPGLVTSGRRGLYDPRVKGSGQPSKIARAEAALRDAALAYPETHEDHPWGETAMKVKGKVFLFMRADESGLGLSVKLPESCVAALLLPFTEPTHYGLGKSGWVSSKFDPKDDVPTELLLEWLDESWRAVAPKRVAAAHDARPGKDAAPRRRKRRR